MLRISTSVILFLAWPGWNAYLQEPSNDRDLRLVDVRTEPEEPSFGEPFDLRVVLRMSPGAVAFLADTVLSTRGVESIGAGAFSSIPGPADSVDIRATYPVIGFRAGTSELPTLRAWVVPGQVRDGTREPVRSAAALGGDPGARAYPYEFGLGATVIGAYRPMADTAAEIAPRPPADVLGGEWNVWLVLGAGLLFAITIGGAAFFLYRRRVRGQGAAATAIPSPPRAEALRELERIRATAWHRNDRTADFYRSTTDVLRRFAERTEPEWGAALTSHEILRKIQERWGREGDLEELVSAVRAAEWVKFGDHRPGPAMAEKHWGAIRDWIRDRRVL